MSTEAAQPALPPWRTEQLRLSAFPNSMRAAGLARDWWNAVTGAPPENVVEEPRKGVVKLQGLYGGELLLMVADENRLDFRQLLQRPGREPAALPEFTGALLPFVQLAIRWLTLDTVPPLQRLAFGAVVMKPASSIEECREVLRGYLPAIDMQKVGLRDFLYQVNRRRSSKTISSLEINRLMKWSIQSVQEIMVNSETRVAIRSLAFGSQLEVDINSDPGQTNVLRSNRLVQLFEEFVHLANQIASVGDHP